MFLMFTPAMFCDAEPVSAVTFPCPVFVVEWFALEPLISSFSSVRRYVCVPALLVGLGIGGFFQLCA